jgi:hypothetical protein
MGLRFESTNEGTVIGNVFSKIFVSLRRMSQDERSIFWEDIVSVIVSKKLHVHMCPIPSGFRDTAISLYSSKIDDKKEILHTVSNTSIYCSSDKVGTVYRQHQCSLQLVWGHGVLLVCTVYSVPYIEIALFSSCNKSFAYNEIISLVP